MMMMMMMMVTVACSGSHMYRPAVVPDAALQATSHARIVVIVVVVVVTMLRILASSSLSLGRAQIPRRTCSSCRSRRAGPGRTAMSATAAAAGGGGGSEDDGQETERRLAVLSEEIAYDRYLQVREGGREDVIW